MDGSSVDIDTTAPTLTSVSISSNNTADTSLANAGDMITVTFAASEAVAPLPTVLIAGHTAVVTSAGGLSYAATLVVAVTALGTLSYRRGNIPDRHTLGT